MSQPASTDTTNYVESDPLLDGGLIPNLIPGRYRPIKNRKENIYLEKLCLGMQVCDTMQQVLIKLRITKIL